MPRLASILFVLLNVIGCYGFRGRWSLFSSGGSRYERISCPTTLAMSASNHLKASPGAPVVNNLDKENLVATVTVTISGKSTKEAFTQSCALFNEEVKKKGYTVPGFRAGATLSAPYLYDIFGKDQVKLFCAKLLARDIQAECEKTGLQLVGKGRVTNFFVDSFEPGSDHSLEIECDLWPEINYKAPGYKGLEVEVLQGGSELDLEKIEKVKQSIRERYKVKTLQETEYRAQLGDVVTVNMRGYEALEGDVKGAALPDVASGDSVDVELEQGKLIGIVEALVGVKAGDKRIAVITFPKRASGPGAALSSKRAVFDFEVLAVSSQQLPDWDAALAERIRPGMTLQLLNEEVRSAVAGEGKSMSDNVRNEALAQALLTRAQVKKLPESVVQESIRAKFEEMLHDFAEQGSDSAQLQEMASPENFSRYSSLARANAEKQVLLGLIFRDIADKEGLKVESREVQQQLDILRAQMKQQGKELQQQDLLAAAEEAENALLRKKVFDVLAGYANITYLDRSATMKEEKEIASK